MKIVKLSNLSNKEREEYERQKIEREERYISSQKKSVPNVITGPTANNNILPKANNWKLATPKETKGAVELTDLATKDYKDNFTQYILDKARLGVQSFGSGIVNLYTTDIQKNNDNALKLSNLVNDKEYNQKIKEKIEEQNKNMIDLSNKISTNDEHSMSIAEQDLPEWQKITGNVVGVVANQLPSIGLNLVAPGTGLSAMGLSAAGNSMNEEINRGTDPKKAQLTGILKGGIEVATEKITGGNIIAKKGSLDNIVGKTIANKVKSKVAQKVLSKGYEIGGEILEEQISDNAGYVIDKLVNNREMPGFEEWYNNAGETTKITFLSTVLMNALGLGGNTHNNVQQNAETQKWINEAEKITQKENSVQNTAQNTAQIANKPIQRQITQPQIKMPQNGNMRQLNILSVANEQNKYTNRIFNESAKKYNIDITDQSMQTINRVLSERNIQGQFNADLFKDDSQSALWKTSKDANGNTIKEVIFNPKASTEKRIQNLLIHELWHDMEGTEISNKLRKLVLDYDSTRSGYEEARQALTETYSQVYDPNSANFNSLIENEAVADILGQKLGDQEFVSNLTRQDRTVGQRLYSEIKYLWNQFRGYKNQNQFVEDLYYKWTQAYNSNKGLNDITHIEEPKTMELPSSEEKAKENKIAKVLLEPVKNQKSKQRTLAILQANLIDKGAVFETLSLKTDNRELQAKYDATLSSGAKGQYAIGNDRYTFENGKKTLQAKSLTSIIDEVGNKVEDFSNYMYHQLNIDRMTLEERFGGDTGINYERKESVKNKPVFGEDITAEYSKQKVEEYENKYPEFKKYAKDIYDYLDANKAELVKNGVISQELSDKFKEMYPHYVPIARINTNNNNIAVPLDTYRTGINNPIKRAKGGSSDIQPLFNTIADRTLQTYRASARNAFGVELKNTLEKNNLLNAINENTDIDTIIDTMADEQQTGLTEGTKYKNPTFTVFENGEKVTYDINLDMYDALKPQNELITKINDTKLSKAVNKISNIRRGLLTEYNPLFSITNSIKDAQDVLQNSQHALKTYRKFPEAYAQIMQKGYWYNEYIQNGGEQNSYFKDGNFELNDNLPKAKKAITMPLKVISKMNNVIEMAPRLAEYIASRESGKSIQTSMLDASRVTTNFKAGGDITKALNRNGATFLNAGVQGMAQQVRNIREAHAKGLKGYAVLATKTILAGMPALILNNLIWDDDEEYENLQDYVKDSYYIVGKIGDNQFIRIPKGRTTAVIQKLFTTADKYITDGKEINIDNFAEDFWTNLLFAKDNIAPNNPIDNNILAPMVQAVSNKTWYGEDLVPSRLQNVPKAEQYDETTDIFSKWVGEKLNISPIKINYVLDQYGGGLSDVLLPLSTPQAENNPIEDKFTTNSVMKSKYLGEFFEKIDELEINSNSSKATDEDKLKYKYISDISKETSDLYKEKREIQNSTLTDKEKKNKLIEVQKQINSLAKEALEKVDTIKFNGNTATINKNKYYKTTDVKDNTKIWKKLSDEELEKNKNISLSTYADYKEKVAQETIKQRKSGNIKEDGSIKDKDKISIVVKSNYSNKEKQGIYEQYILSDTDKKYSIIKNTNININQYLKYKVQESKEAFSSDKKDDGTVKGKTIVNSAKNKRYEYIMNMPITHTQKLVLWALEYEPSNNSEKKQLINYVETLPNKTKKEQLDILSNFKGVTIYKDGTFDY